MNNESSLWIADLDDASLNIDSQMTPLQKKRSSSLVDRLATNFNVVRAVCQNALNIPMGNISTAFRTGALTAATFSIVLAGCKKEEQTRLPIIEADTPKVVVEHIEADLTRQQLRDSIQAYSQGRPLTTEEWKKVTLWLEQSASLQEETGRIEDEAARTGVDLRDHGREPIGYEDLTGDGNTEEEPSTVEGDSISQGEKHESPELLGDYALKRVLRIKKGA